MLPGDPRRNHGLPPLPVPCPPLCRPSLPAEIPKPWNEDRNQIVDLLCEENKRIKPLKWLLDIWEQNNSDILDAYCNTPTAALLQQQQGWPGA